MAESNDLGVFYQGQIINISISSKDNATEDELAILSDNDLYIGVYSNNRNEKQIFSVDDGTMSKTVNSDGSVTISCVISALQTKEMSGAYALEVLIKNDDNTFTSPCENVVSFVVKARRISEVIR